MNAGLDDNDSVVLYYDSDYPSQHHGHYSENFDEVTKFQGIAFDVERYKEIAAKTGGPILELCCGTGRVAIPLARAGFPVTGVDISAGMLRQFESNLAGEDHSVLSRIQLVKQDVTGLALEKREFPLAIIAFNSLLCITDFEAQCQALCAIAGHLALGGVLVLDVVNPLVLKIQGDEVPKPFFTRRSPERGNIYTRFAMTGPFDEQQRQRLYGWYDEIDSAGCVRRSFYSMHWRPVFRFEIELMLRQAGFELIKIEGGHQQEPYDSCSPRMFIQAKRI
jgi:ubiquinone/menaquinone biosynthesis C-methylase UbiE